MRRRIPNCEINQVFQLEHQRLNCVFENNETLTILFTAQQNVAIGNCWKELFINYEAKLKA